MFLREHVRKKDGKEHRYWTVVENRRVSGGHTVQRHVLYLGEINSSQQASWRKTIEVFGDESQKGKTETLALFPDDRGIPVDDTSVVQIRLKDLVLRHPRQWGACWLGCELYDQLGLNEFWSARLPVSRKGTRWDLTLKMMAIYRLLDPGSEWKLHRQWFDQTAIGDLLGEDFELAEIHRLYTCLDKLLKHKKDLFDHLTQKWKGLFNTTFEVLLYDLTSSYFESEPPFGEKDKRKFGYSRDKRSDCVQVVIALIVTPEGFPIAYEVMSGNTSDKTTLKDFLKKIEAQYGKAKRIWLMDRGIPTETVLEEMRKSEPPVYYLVGTPRGRLTSLEKGLTSRPWEEVRAGVKVKMLPCDGDLYVLARSDGRVNKERAIRRRQMKLLWKRLKELKQMELTRDELLMKLGSAKQQTPAAWRLVAIKTPGKDEAVNADTFTFALRKDKLRRATRREGHYILRSNLCDQTGEQLWSFDMQLVQVEEAFRNLKGDLNLRPFHHQKETRIEAHIFVAFIAYSLYVTLNQRLKALAAGLTPRAVLDKFRSVQLIDVHLPTTDGRTIILPRYTEPENELKILLQGLHLTLPQQPPPKVAAQPLPPPCGADLSKS
jgi:transposase